MSKIWRAYTKFVDKFPWGSQILQTGVLCASGDVIAQVLVERKKLEEFEISRVGRFFLMGSCVVAPCIRSWYLVLERIVKIQGNNQAEFIVSHPAQVPGLPSPRWFLTRLSLLLASW